MQRKLGVKSIGIDSTHGNIVQLVKKKKKKIQGAGRNVERNNTEGHKVAIR